MSCKHIMFCQERLVVTSLITGHNEIVAKVIFLHLSVILFTGEGVCLSACWDTTPLRSRHPPEQTPWEQTPPPEQTPPLGADTPQGADTPPPLGSRLRHTVNERPVRILLECILVVQYLPHYIQNGQDLTFKLLEIYHTPEDKIYNRQISRSFLSFTNISLYEGPHSTSDWSTSEEKWKQIFVLSFRPWLALMIIREMFPLGGTSVETFH